MAHASVLPVRLTQLGILGLALLVGLAAGINPAYGAAMALGVAYVSIVIADLAFGLILFVGLVFLETVGGLPLAKGAGALLALSWIALVATDRTQRNMVGERPGLTVALVLLGAWAGISLLWAELPGLAVADAQRWVLNLVLFPIVYVAVRETRHVRAILAVFVLGALVSAAIGVATGTTDDGRLAGSGVHPNELGMQSIVAVAIAIGLGSSRGLGAPARALAFAGAGLAFAALVATGSRGGLLGLGVAVLVAPLLAGPGRRGLAVLIIAAGIGIGFSYMATLAPAASVERLTMSGDSGSGRTNIWTVGWRMVQDNPVQGVGAGNFANSTIHYLLEPGALPRSDVIVDDPKDAHNVYLQALTELGIVGLVLFVAVLGIALRSLLQAARTFARIGDRSMEVLARALLVGLCGMLAALTFSTDIFSKQLWLMLALSVAVAGMARAAEARVS